jgi:hypothetical protein
VPSKAQNPAFLDQLPDMIPIGQGMVGVHLLVINRDDRTSNALWEQGELYLRAGGLAEGYLGNDEKTAELNRSKFIPRFANPWGVYPEEQLKLTSKGREPYLRESRYPQEVIRSYVPLKMQGRSEPAVADTGAQENVMSETLARKLKLTIHKPETKSHHFVNAIGESMSAIGYTTIRCNFEDEPQNSQSGSESKFWVFSKLVVPLVVGRRFLESTGTLTRFRHRLQKIIAPQGVSLRILHMELPRWRMNCRVGEKMVLANPDTGSDLDLMSAS